MSKRATQRSQPLYRSTRRKKIAAMYLSLVRWAFQRFYHEFAWTYDVVAWMVSRGLWRRWTYAALPYVEGRVLELGCGTGYVQHALAAHRGAENVVGLDASPHMLNLTRRRVRRAGFAVTLLRAVSQALPFASATFHSVLATFPSEYILHPDTLTEIRRVLVTTGRLVIVDGAQFTDDGIYERVVDLAYRLTLQAPVRNVPATDPRLAALDRAGFAVEVHWETVGPSQVMILVGTKQHFM